MVIYVAPLEKKMVLPMHKQLLSLIALLITGTQSLAAEPPIKIGALFALSGWAAIGGRSELNATTMAIDEINAAGGVLGRPIELVVEDNRSDLRATVSAVIKLKNIDSVPVIFGPNWAEFADVAAPVFESSKVIMLTALSQDADKEKAENLGVDDYLVKSQVVIADVIERIKQRLDS